MKFDEKLMSLLKLICRCAFCTSQGPCCGHLLCWGPGQHPSPVLTGGLASGALDAHCALLQALLMLQLWVETQPGGS